MPEAKLNNWGLHWFRRDLRIPGNLALRYNWQNNQQKVLGIFCFDSLFLNRKDFSHHRFAFFLKSLKALKEELVAQGGDLLVVDKLPENFFKEFFFYLKKHQKPLPSMISFNRDYEPFARQRDAKMEFLFQNEGIPCFTARDHLIIEPWEIQKNEPGSFYQVYSPFARKWFEKLLEDKVQDRIKEQDKIFSYYDKLKNQSLDRIFKLQWHDVLDAKDMQFPDALDEFINKNNASVKIPIPDAGFLHAFERLNKFSSYLNRYKEDRDFPFMDGTSQLSLYFKNGSLIPTQVLSFLKLSQQQFKDKNGPAHFVKEIAWREFYYSILFHCPEVETGSFLKQYKDLSWENNEDWFLRWCEGTTGFPIVDAGMRQLNTTGWMHNRVRMIVASFLTKDLLIDWRWGENYFMQKLLDGDLAPNNGGWQWAASTGCDPQPYFRIFNPWLQSAKFDPDGIYIKKYIPELKTTSAKDLHDPDGFRYPLGYPKPMIQHALQKEKALAMFKINSTIRDH